MRTFLTLALAFCAPSWAAMPVAEQNTLVQRYCAVCHTDAVKNGGLTLEHYDAARPDPTLAAMMLSKLNSGAMGAAGNGVPDKPAQEAWLASTIEQAAGAMDWFVSRENGVVSASIVREVPARQPPPAAAPLYRLSVACNASTGAGEMQLSWSPQPQTGLTMNALVDHEAPVGYAIEGKESMGNGTIAKTGHAAVILSGNGAKLHFPKDSLTIRDLFPDEVVVFPFTALDQKVRSELRACF